MSYLFLGSHQNAHRSFFVGITCARSKILGLKAVSSLFDSPWPRQHGLATIRCLAENTLFFNSRAKSPSDSSKIWSMSSMFALMRITGAFLVSLLSNLVGDTLADFEKAACAFKSMSSCSSSISSKSLLLGLVDWKLLLLLPKTGFGFPGSVKVSPRALLFLT